jgi:hypothetical protein
LSALAQRVLLAWRRPGPDGEPVVATGTLKDAGPPLILWNKRFEAGVETPLVERELLSLQLLAAIGHRQGRRVAYRRVPSA